MRVLITGGCGFIASNLIRHLRRTHPDWHLVVLDMLTYAGSMDNLPLTANEVASDPSFTFHYGNVCNASLVEAAIEGVDCVIHTAAESHVTRSIYDNRVFIETDVLGTQTVLNAALRAGVKRVIHISSSEVYGTALSEKMDESHSLNPMSPYAAAKAGADRLAYSYFVTYRLPVVIVRPFNQYGTHQHLEKVVPRFITSILMREPLSVHGDGSAERDYLFVLDLCRALEALILAPGIAGEVLNIGSEVSHSVLSIAEDICRLMGYPTKNIQQTNDRPGQVLRHTCNSGKIRGLTGWAPTVGWHEGLSRTVDWYEASRHLWTRQLWLRHVPITLGDGSKVMH